MCKIACLLLLLVDRKLQKIPTSRSENDIFCSQNDEFAMQIMASVGQDLRRIAEQIEASRERDIIRQRAENVIIPLIVAKTCIISNPIHLPLFPGQHQN